MGNTDRSGYLLHKNENADIKDVHKCLFLNFKDLKNIAFSSGLYLVNRERSTRIKN